MTLPQILSHLDRYGIQVIIDKEAGRLLRPASGIETQSYRDNVRRVIPHLQARWEEFEKHIYRLRDTGASDWRENPETDGTVYRIARPRETPAQARRRIYRNTLMLAKIFDSRVYGECGYDYSAKPFYLEWKELEASNRFPPHWTAVCVAKLTMEYQQIGGMFSGCLGVPAVRVAPIWTKLPGSVPPKGWRPPVKAKPKRYNPWKSETTWKESMPPD